MPIEHIILLRSLEREGRRWFLVVSILRFFLEMIRDDERGDLAGLSTSQWIAIPLVALGCYLWASRPDAAHQQPA